ncbi:Uncharacterised protein [Mycobacterium tuberculosis]|nr:Uncharacterised protein [Mycobacterium tuberculosis]
MKRACRLRVAEAPTAPGAGAPELEASDEAGRG